MKLKKIFIGSCLTATILCGDSFNFNSIKRNSSGDIVEKGLKVENTKEIIATGYGRDKEQAINNAFQSAIQQYVGVVIDSETIVKNGTLIKDEILTASNGFIKHYEEISIKTEDGLLEVQIKATVKSQKLFAKIKSLKITTITFHNTISGKDLKAEISTKLKSKKDSAKILKKVMNNFYATDSIQEMLDLKITNVKVDKDNIKNNQIPMIIDYTLTLNYDVYIQKIKELEQTFKNLGAKLHKRVDLPYIHDKQLIIKNTEKVKKLLSTDFGIIKKYGQGYKLDVWSFPKEWKDIYPFNAKDSLIWTDLFQIVLELKDNSGEVILADTLHKRIDYKYILNSATKFSSYYTYQFKEYGTPILKPIFFTSNFNSYIRNLNDFSTTQMVNLENIDKVQDISIELEQK
jgi:ribosomal protein S8